MFLFKMLSRIGVLQGVTNSNSSRTTQSSSSRDSFNGGGIRAIGLESSQGNVLVMGRVRVRFGLKKQIEQDSSLFIFLRNFCSTTWWFFNSSKAGDALKHWKIIKNSPNYEEHLCSNLPFEKTHWLYPKIWE